MKTKNMATVFPFFFVAAVVQLQATPLFLENTLKLLFFSICMMSTAVRWPPKKFAFLYSWTSGRHNRHMPVILKSSCQLAINLPMNSFLCVGTFQEHFKGMRKTSFPIDTGYLSSSGGDFAVETRP